MSEMHAYVDLSAARIGALFFNICNVILNLEIVDENRTNFELFSTCALCRGMPPVQVFGGVHCRVCHGVRFCHSFRPTTFSLSVCLCLIFILRARLFRIVIAITFGYAGSARFSGGVRLWFLSFFKLK